MPQYRRLELSRIRAETAYKNAKTASEKNFKPEYKSLVLKSPTLVKNNGLLSTIAFLFSKRKNESGKAHALLYKQIAEWLKEMGIVELSDGSHNNFAKELTELPPGKVRFATNETLAYLSWLKRFTEGLIDKEDTDASN